MRGDMFREFLDFVSNATSAGFVHDMLTDVRSASGAAIHPDGEHDMDDVVRLMAYASRKTGYARDEMERDFGARILALHIRQAPELFRETADALDLFEALTSGLNALQQTETRRLAAPVLTANREGAGVLRVDYRSPRGLAALCGGIFDAALEHCGGAGSIERQENAPGGVDVTFWIRTAAAPLR